VSLRLLYLIFVRLCDRLVMLEDLGSAGRQRLRAVCFRAGSTRRASGLGLLS